MSWGSLPGPHGIFHLRHFPTHFSFNDFEQRNVRRAHVFRIRQQGPGYGSADGIKLADAARNQINQDIRIANHLQCLVYIFRVHKIRLCPGRASFRTRSCWLLLFVCLFRFAVNVMAKLFRPRAAPWNTDRFCALPPECVRPGCGRFPAAARAIPPPGKNHLGHPQSDSRASAPLNPRPACRKIWPRSPVLNYNRQNTRLQTLNRQRRHGAPFILPFHWPKCKTAP